MAVGGLGRARGPSGRNGVEVPTSPRRGRGGRSRGRSALGQRWAAKGYAKKLA